jgi:hypothetical protein
MIMFVQYNTKQNNIRVEGKVGGGSLGYEKKEEAKKDLVFFLCSQMFA